MPDPWLMRYGTTEFEFSDESGIFLRKFPEISSYEIVAGDVKIPYGDGETAGVDLHGGRTLGLSFGIEGRTETEARSRRATLERLWNAREIRKVGGAVVELVDLTTGLSAVGRPREIANSSVRLHDTPPGYDVQATFRMLDPLWHGPLQSIAVGLGISQGGGLVAPLKAPLVARGYTKSSNSFTVGGDFPTWGVITIPGPVLNPAVEVPGAFRFAANTALRMGEWITIDTRPGRRSVTRNGDSIQNLSRTSTPLADSEIPTGPQLFRFTGSSSNANPTASLQWSALHSIT